MPGDRSSRGTLDYALLHPGYVRSLHALMMA
jgi:hypothetical protein